MSLRLRLALALALLSAVATSAVCITSYLSTQDRLYEEIDVGLADGAKFLLSEPSISGGFDPFGRPRRSGSPNNSIPNQPNLRRELERFDFLIVQLIAVDGTVSETSGTGLPVADNDRAIAAAQSGTAIKSVNTSDTVYRVHTVARSGGALQVARDISRTRDVLVSLRNRYLITAIVASALAAALGWLIARSVARPLQRLTQAVEHVSVTGDLETSVGHEGRDEVGRLAQAFNGMTSALSRSRSQQQQLVQDAGHELRTPLTSLRTNVALLKRRDRMTPQQVDSMVTDIDSELGELTGLVNELVELATDSRDDEPVQEVDLQRIGERCAERVKRRTGRDVLMRLSPTVINGQPLSLERAITNLLENAAKFDATGAPIELTITDDRIEVKDRGAGIAAEDLAHIFDRFYRATATRSAPGSGLGLSIVAEIARRHGGEPFATNAESGGAIVGFTFAD